jgi:putative DNA methylase
MRRWRDRRGGRPRGWDNGDELREALLDFIADFADWDNAADRDYLETARRLVHSAHEALDVSGGSRPLVADPFAGGGSIPLEALRVGADAFASDLNPVAVLLNKVILEHIPRLGLALADEVRRSGKWIRGELERETRDLYPPAPKGETVIAYLWARTIISEAPQASSEPVEIPLLKSMWLAKKAGRKRAFRWRRDNRGHVLTETVDVTYANGTSRRVRRPLLEVFEPARDSEVQEGTSAGGAATCPVTGVTTPVERVRAQLAERCGGARDSRLVGIVALRSSQSGRHYRTPTPEESSAVARALACVDQELSSFAREFGSAGEGSINHLRGFFNIVLYGMTSWRDVFNARQLIVLLKLSRLVRIAARNAPNPDSADALEACLALVVGRMADGNSSLVRWQNMREIISNTFGRQALPMVWDYAEANPFCDATRSLESMFDWVIEVIEHESVLQTPGRAEQGSATRHLLPDDSVDLVFTDPPYYAAVPYADLSDFFYSWLAPVLRDRYPALFGSLLTPKEEECVQLSHRAAMYRNKTKEWFESTMGEACSEARRITKPSGAGVFVFASKETAAWEAMLGALIDAGWVVTASWPVDTEMGSRLRAQDSAALASSIHIVCRPRENADGAVDDAIGDWRDVQNELPSRIREWMTRLAAEGIVGADAIFACLGPALEVFSRYARVEKASGEAVPLAEFLEHVWAAVSNAALSSIFAGADAAGLEPDARLTAMWLWTVGAQTSNSAATEDSEEAEEGDDEVSGNAGKRKSIGGLALEFDAARKIAQGLGAHLERMPSIVEVKGETARLLPVAARVRDLFGRAAEMTASGAKRRPERRVQTSLFAEMERAETSSGGWGGAGAPNPGATTLDKVHQAMLLFAGGRGEALRHFLVDAGAASDSRFWKLAQALSALYPAASEEKRWIDGVLARKKSLGV